MYDFVWSEFVSSIERVLANELQTYELHLLSKQKSIILQFEETASTSRASCIKEELARINNQEQNATVTQVQREEYMKEFEENLDREIDVQRKQLKQTLAANRNTKLQAYKDELIAKMETLMQQQQPPQQQREQQQQQQQQPQQPLNSTAYSFASSPVSISTASIPSLLASPSSVNISSFQQTPAVQTSLLQESSVQEPTRLMNTQPINTSSLTVTSQHRYEYIKPKVMRVDNTPQPSPRPVAPAASPSPSHLPLDSPQFSPIQHQPIVPAFKPPAVASAHPPPLNDPESKLRQQWYELQQELHGHKNLAPPTHTYQPLPPAAHLPHHTFIPQPLSSPLQTVPSHLQTVSASPTTSVTNATTTQTLGKIEAALEMDWNDAWEELSQQQQIHQQQQKQLQQQQLLQPPLKIEQSPQPSPQHQYAPARTPLTEKLTKAVVAVPHSPQTRSPISQPLVTLHQKRGMFKETLADLESKAEYLHQLIQSFKDAEREMDEKVSQMESNTYQRRHEIDERSHVSDYDESPRFYGKKPSASHVAFAPPVRARSAVRSQSIPASRPTSARSYVPVARPAPSASAKQLVRSASVSIRPASRSLSGAPAALSYPRPRTASARASLGASSGGPPRRVGTKEGNKGVNAARSRIRAIINKTKERPRAISVLSAAHPATAYIDDPLAKGGLRQASVQEALNGAHLIAARKSMPPKIRDAVLKKAAKPIKPKTDPIDYDFEPSTDEHPIRPLTVAEASQKQLESSLRLNRQPGMGSPFQSHDSSFELDHSGDLNTTAGLIKQEEMIQKRHDGQVEAYLRALMLPAKSEARQHALRKLAEKAEKPHHLYTSPLRRRR